MKRQHIVPCKECPFRKESVPGWLGGEEYQDGVVTCAAFAVFFLAGAAASTATRTRFRGALLGGPFEGSRPSLERQDSLLCRLCSDSQS